MFIVRLLHKVGGNDGVFIATDGVHLKLTEINMLKAMVYSVEVGRVSREVLDGQRMVGINDIQPGLWSSFGGASASYQSYGDWQS